MDELLKALKAAGDATRLRILHLCAHSELTVTDLVNILSQSQPRVSRHLKIMVEAGLLDRHQEGSWALYRLAGSGAAVIGGRPPSECAAALASSVIDLVPEGDPVSRRDLQRLAQIRENRQREAEDFFETHADEWEEIRAQRVDMAALNRHMRDAVLDRPVTRMLDIGTGTAGVLSLVGREIENAIGVDTSKAMIAQARANLERDGLRNCQIRMADMYQLPFASNAFDLATMHMVLHYATDPQIAVSEAARVLAPGGRLIIADFEEHGSMEAASDGEDDTPHVWPGFSSERITRWLAEAGLTPAGEDRVAEEPLPVTIWQAEKR